MLGEIVEMVVVQVLDIFMLLGYELDSGVLDINFYWKAFAGSKVRMP